MVRVGKTAGLLRPFSREQIARLQRENLTVAPGYAPPSVPFVIDHEYVINGTALSGDKLILHTRGSLHVLDRESGEEIWGLETLLSYINMQDDFIYLFEPKNKVSKVEVATGEEIWQFPIRSEVRRDIYLTDKAVLFALLDEKMLHCLDLETGKLKWRRTFPNSKFPFHRLTATNQNVICSPSPAVIRALALETGESRWETELKISPENETPNIFTGSKQIYVHKRNARGFLVLNAADGSERFRFDHTNRLPYFAPHFSVGSRFDFASDNVYLFALEPASGSIVWRQPLPPPTGGILGSLIPVTALRIFNQRIYYVAGLRHFRVAQEDNGKLVRDIDCGESLEGAWFAKENRAFFTVNARELHAYDLNTASILWSYAGTEWEDLLDRNVGLNTSWPDLFFCRTSPAHPCTLFALKEANSPALLVVDDKLESPAELSADKPILTDQDFQHLIRDGYALYQPAPKESPLIITARVGADTHGPIRADQRDAIIHLDVFAPANHSHVGTFALKITKAANLARECLTAVQIDFSVEARSYLTKNQFGGFLDLEQLGKLIDFKTGAASYVNLGPAKPVGKMLELIPADQAFFKQPGAVTLLTVPDTSLWISDTYKTVALDRLLISIALRVAGERFQALGFEISPSSRYPLRFWSEVFGAGSAYAQRWAVPLAGSIDEIVTIQEVESRRASGDDWTD